jgi:hypothetical protein
LRRDGKSLDAEIDLWLIIMSHVRDAGNNNYKASGGAVGQLASNKAATAQKRASFAAAIITLLELTHANRNAQMKCCSTVRCISMLTSAICVCDAWKACKFGIVAALQSSVPDGCLCGVISHDCIVTAGFHALKNNWLQILIGFCVIHMYTH